MLFLVFLLRLLQPHKMPGTLGFRVTGVSEPTTGVLSVAYVLTNSTPRSLNVVDDIAGNPAFLIEDGTSLRMWITMPANRCMINLAASASLSKVLLLTNPPQHFRLKSKKHL
jgi:hypothetical protein